MMIISLKSANWLVFEMNMHCVLCEMKTEFLIIIWMNFRLQGVNYVILKCNLDKTSFEQSECTRYINAEICMVYPNINYI